MQYYSTRKQSSLVSLKQAVIQGLAIDKGLFMPEKITRLSPTTIRRMKHMNLIEIGNIIAQSFFGEDIPPNTLDHIVNDTLRFDIPIVNIHNSIYALELFHGPTLAFKDVGARFMAHLLKYFIKEEEIKNINILVATSGDTGSAVANGFLGIEGITVYILYPKGKVSKIQEHQFTTLGKNIIALEINGTFDDCQALVKTAFLDHELNKQKRFTSANSINIARLLPQSFYYFHAYAQLNKLKTVKELIISVPSGNLGNLCAGLVAWKMGLPIKHLIVANNKNDVFSKYLTTGIYTPKPSINTYASAMDVGNPSNFERIQDLFAKFSDPYQGILSIISGHSYSDESIAKTIQQVYYQYHYLLDPHGATAYQALIDELISKEIVGLFLETAHPSKFKNTVDKILAINTDIPIELQKFINKEIQTIKLEKNFLEFKEYLLSQS